MFKDLSYDALIHAKIITATIGGISLSESQFLQRTL